MLASYPEAFIKEKKIASKAEERTKKCTHSLYKKKNERKLIFKQKAFHVTKQ